MGTLFENCLPNTLDTTVLYATDGTDNTLLDSFVITGDIPALWLRDSANQVMPYVPYVTEDPALATLVEGLIARQAASVLLDPYANAFNYNASGEGHQHDIVTPAMKPAVFESKYEIDSLSAFLKVSYWYWRYSSTSSFMTPDWLSAVDLARSTIETMQADTGYLEDPPYMFQRETTAALDTLELYGRGPPVRLTGLSRSLFRPSDDAVTMGYNVPGNAMACTELTHMTSMLRDVGKENEAILNVAEGTAAVAAKICGALDEIILEASSGAKSSDRVLPYELDGYGSVYRMDDANVPSLLSLPFLGYMGKTHPTYKDTRDYVLSSRNPFYFSGVAGEGVGGPHVGYNFAWPMAITMRAMTSDSDEEIASCLELLLSSALETGLMHESFNVNDVNDYTRSWFAWANGLFGELLLQLIHTKPHLILIDDKDIIEYAQNLVQPPVSYQAQQEVLH
jgi:meiotically up-regulated gene 157 (Mug157) protein